MVEVNIREDEIEVPQIEIPELKPPEPEYPEPPEPLDLVGLIWRLRDTIIAVLDAQYAGNPLWGSIGWLIKGAIHISFFSMQVFVALLQPFVDIIQETVYDVQVAWINFKKSVEEHYKGDWSRAIVDLAFRVVLLSALDQALNIPAIKQLVDMYIETIKKIREVFASLRNGVNVAFQNLWGNVYQYIQQNNNLLKYILGEEFKFWTTEINKFITDVQKSLIKHIDETEQRLFGEYYKIADIVEKTLNELEEFKRQFYPKTVSAVKQYIAESTHIEYIEWGPREAYQWLRSKWQLLQAKVTEFLNRIYQILEEHFGLREYDLSAIYREMMRELLDDDSEMNKHLDKLVQDIEELDDWLEKGNTVIMKLKGDDIEMVMEEKK
jgi:hypothetical protein